MRDLYREIRSGTYTEGAVSDLYRENDQGLIQRRLGVGCMRKSGMGCITGNNLHYSIIQKGRYSRIDGQAGL